MRTIHATLRTVEHHVVHFWTAQHNYHRGVLPYVWTMTAMSALAVGICGFYVWVLIGLVR